MRIATCVAFMLTLVLTSVQGGAEPIAPTEPSFKKPSPFSFLRSRRPHAHPPNVTGLGAAHADRFVGMMYAAQCDVDEAAEYFGMALSHDSTDPEIVGAPDVADEFLVRKSNELVALAQAGETRLQDIVSGRVKRQMSPADHKLYRGAITLAYAQAFLCNPNNQKAFEGFKRMDTNQ